MEAQKYAPPKKKTKKQNKTKQKTRQEKKKVRFLKLTCLLLKNGFPETFKVFPTYTLFNSKYGKKILCSKSTPNKTTKWPQNH